MSKEWGPNTGAPKNGAPKRRTLHSTRLAKSSVLKGISSICAYMFIFSAHGILAKHRLGVSCLAVPDLEGAVARELINPSPIVKKLRLLIY
jgi:hypothetical protein